MKRIYIALIFYVSIVSRLISQDIHFSQIQESPLWLSPANTGFYNGYLRAIANYRSQWTSMGNPYQTIALSVDAAVLKSTKKKSYLGVGLLLFNDQAGYAKMGSTVAQLNISGILRTGRSSKMSGGICAGMGQNKANLSSLTYGNQYTGKDIDATIASGENVANISFLYADVGAGLNYEYSNASTDMLRDDVFSLKIGGAVHHINMPMQSYVSSASYRLPMRYVGNVQARIDFSGTYFSLLPSLIYIRQASASEVVVGTHFRYRFKNGTKITGLSTETGLNIGVYYRLGDAIIPQLNLDMGKYAIGFSYDVNISKYRTVSNYSGGLEVYLKLMSLNDALFKRKREHGL